jgi:hypothetical protein
MLKNHNHDLIQQLSEISDSAWRMNDYVKAAKGCKHCTALWKKLKSDYEAHVKMLSQEIKRHVDQGKFN